MKNEKESYIDMNIPNMESPFVYDSRLNDPLQDVFHYLSLKDLSILACVSKKFYSYIETYCKLMCKALSLGNRLQTFFESQLVLLEEIEDRRILREADHTFKWLFVKGMMLRRVYRKSVTRFNIDDLGTNDEIRRIYDNGLRREIAEVEAFIRFNLTHKFQSVSPGVYRVILRTNVNGMLWPCHDGIITIRVHWADQYGNHEKKAEIKWNKGRELRNALYERNSVRLKGALACSYESRNGWFNFCLENIHLSEMCDVTFGLHNPPASLGDDYYESCIQWDYVELKPMDQLDKF